MKYGVPRPLCGDYRALRVPQLGVPENIKFLLSQNKGTFVIGQIKCFVNNFVCRDTILPWSLSSKAPGPGCPYPVKDLPLACLMVSICHGKAVNSVGRRRKPPPLQTDMPLKPNSRDHFVYAPSQWETMLHCNVVSHWLGACTKWGDLFNKWKINSLAPERCSTCNLKSVILKDTCCGLSSRALLTELLSGKHLDLLWLVNMVSGNALVPSGNKLLTEALLTQIYAILWCH